MPAPIERGHDLYLLVEAPTGEAGVEVFENFLAEIYEKGLVKDAVIAKSRAERDKLWALRECVYEYGNFLPQAVGFDVSIPLTACRRPWRPSGATCRSWARASSG